MSSLKRRRRVLGGALVAVGVLTAALLWNVVGTVFFAITVAYVLYPLRQRLVDRGVPQRIASAVVTTAAFLVVIALFAPIVLILFERRGSFIDLLNNLPDELPIELFGFVYEVDLADLVVSAEQALRSLAISVAADAIFISLQFGMFVLVLYGLLLRPRAVGDAIHEITPREYHDVLGALHRRVAGTLYALYVIQAATAVVTFPFALLVFHVLGYPDAFVLGVLAAIFQFVPILGPGVLAFGLAGHDVLLGLTDRAIAVAILGPVVIGLVPDLLVRPRMARKQAKLPASLYFVGFTGGVLTIGVIGVIAGPLVVAILVELVDLLGDGTEES
jgi:predicted PurR-regulated permease PerM